MAGRLSGRAAAWLNLAWRFGAHVLVRMPRRLIGRGQDLQRFLDAVEPEGYTPLDAVDRDAMPGAMRCIHCGLCSLACAELRERTASAWEEPWTFVAGPSRSIDRAELVALDVPPCATTDAAAAVCPTGVPIPTLTRLATAARAATSAGGSVGSVDRKSSAEP